MSQQELYELHTRVREHATLLQEQIQKSQASYDTLMDQDQLKFIVSLHPIPPDVAV